MHFANIMILSPADTGRRWRSYRQDDLSRIIRPRQEYQHSMKNNYEGATIRNFRMVERYIDFADFKTFGLIHLSEAIIIRKRS